MITVRKSKTNITAVVISIAVFAVLAVFVAVMLGDAVSTSGEEALQVIEDSVIRAVVSCYAYEGFYPDSIDYLVKNYNLAVDTERYLIYYDKMFDNLMPNIIVSEVVR